MNEYLAPIIFAVLFVCFGLFLRHRLSGCAGADCEKRAAGGCGCHGAFEEEDTEQG